MDEATASISAVAAELGLSPSRIRQLTDLGIFTARRTEGGHRRYDLMEVRAAWLRYQLERAGVDRGLDLASSNQRPMPLTSDQTLMLAGLEEDKVWEQLKPTLQSATSPSALRIVTYAFTEILNNAIDHSDGKIAIIRTFADAGMVRIEIQDDGNGIFAHLANGLGLDDDFTAIQELSKGKRTTDPDRHTGEGIFFTSKAVEVFRVAANGISWTVDNVRGDVAVGISTVTSGTLVTLEVDPASSKDLGSLFREFTEDHEFNRTRPAVKLFGLGVSFVSRSEAKRLLEGLDRFDEVDVDFIGVESVGQGFVDEMLRVWPREHPGTKLIPIGMNSAVRFMVERGLAR